MPGFACGKTDLFGVANWTLVGSASNLTGHAPGAGYKCATILAGTSLAPVAGININVGAYDQNGIGGVNPVDVSLLLSDLLFPIYVGRDDYNCTNAPLNVVDLSMLLSVAIGFGSTNSCPSYCW